MSQTTKKPRHASDPDARKSTLELIAEVIPNHEEWLGNPHPLLAARIPRDLIGLPEEAALWTLVLSLKDGSFS